MHREIDLSTAVEPNEVSVSESVEAEADRRRRRMTPDNVQAGDNLPPNRFSQAAAGKKTAQPKQPDHVTGHVKGAIYPPRPRLRYLSSRGRHAERRPPDRALISAI